MLKYLNLGCGNSPVKSTDKVLLYNVDAFYKDERILNFDITKYPYPFEDNMFDRIMVFHTIEHIPYEIHGGFLTELRRIIKDTGELVLAYPEFKRIAQNWLDNKNNDRDFWRATIYGRGNSEWDRHKALMDTEEFEEVARRFGFQLVGAVPERNQDFNTIAVFIKCPPKLTHEDLLRAECLA